MQRYETRRAGKKWVGQSVNSKNALSFIKGAGQYLDDISIPGTLHASFCRSPYAHAQILRIDLERAMKRPGFVASLTGKELERIMGPLPVAQAAAEGFTIARRNALPGARTTYVGEPVVVLAARSREESLDLIDDVVVEYEPLSAVVEPEKALAGDAPLLYKEVPNNTCFSWSFNAGDTESALRKSHAVIEEKFRIERVTGTPMEPRGILAHYDSQNMLTVWVSTQFPHQFRTELARILRFPESMIRVITPDVGGGFGIKVEVYPEEVLVCALSIKTGKPVKWVQTRQEDLLNSIHARPQVHDVKVGYQRDGKITGIDDFIIADIGAYLQFWGVASPSVSAVVLPGPYDIRNYSFDLRCVHTNKTPTGAYRGFGRQEGCFVMERMVDRIAGELGLEPAEVRFRNFVRAEQIPYTTATGLPYDSGDYPLMLSKALTQVDYHRFRAEQKKLRSRGVYKGIGISFYVEATGYAPPRWLALLRYRQAGHEVATVRIEPTGSVSVLTGAPTIGQGLETTLAQLCADELSVDVDIVNVPRVDTSTIVSGVGTFASRGAVVAGTAVVMASRKVRRKALRIAAHMLKTDPSNLEMANGMVSQSGTSHSVPLSAVAEVAYLGQDLPEGEEPGLQETSFFAPTEQTFSFSAHVAMVDVDVETGRLKVERYVVAHDCGRVINPAVVEGQVCGGVAQGLGQALLEELVYNSDGQLLTSTFADYLIPTADHIPNIELIHSETLSTTNPTGIKGVGESGAIGPTAAIANAVQDAVGSLIQPSALNQLPLRSDRMWLALSRFRERRAR